jgi:hypothetical protein
MNTENRVQRKYKRYDENFKRNAVELWRSSGKSAEAVAAELGITVYAHRIKSPLSGYPRSRARQVRSSRAFPENPLPCGEDGVLSYGCHTAR